MNADRLIILSPMMRERPCTRLPRRKASTVSERNGRGKVRRFLVPCRQQPWSGCCERNLNCDGLEARLSVATFLDRTGRFPTRSRISRPFSVLKASNHDEPAPQVKKQGKGRGRPFVGLRGRWSPDRCMTKLVCSQGLSHPGTRCFKRLEAFPFLRVHQPILGKFMRGRVLGKRFTMVNGRVVSTAGIPVRGQ